MSRDYIARHANDLVEYAVRRANFLGGKAFVDGGNSFGHTAVLGTNDAFGLNIETGGTTRLIFGNANTLQFGTGLGFSLTIAGTGSLTTLGGGGMTVDAAPGTGLFLGTSTAFQTTLGRAGANTIINGSILTLTATAGAASLDASGTINVGITTATSILIGHSGINTAVSGGDGGGATYAMTVVNPNNTNTSDALIVEGGTNAGSGAILIDFRRFDGTEIGFVQQASATSVVYTTTSDARLKDNIEDYTHGLDLLQRMRVHTFTFKSDETKKQHVGFLAQEVLELFPDAGSTARENQFLGVDYGRITPLLVKAIQDLADKVDQLTEMVNKSRR